MKFINQTLSLHQMYQMKKLSGKFNIEKLLSFILKISSKKQQFYLFPLMQSLTLSLLSATLQELQVYTNNKYIKIYNFQITGPPKGAMLTHKNFVSITASLEEINFNKTDYILCYLPLPHVMQRLINVACWATGAKIAFFGGDMLKLKDDIQAVKPTIFISVPRLFNKFYDAINDNLSTFKSCKGGLI